MTANDLNYHYIGEICLANNDIDAMQSVENNNKAKNGSFSNSAKEKNQIVELKTDIDELSNEIQSSVSDLKKSISNIRATVTEIENPFNVLKSISSEKEDVQNQSLPPGIKSISLGKPRTNDDKKLEPLIPQIEETSKPAQSAVVKPIVASKYINWIWDLFDVGLAAGDIRELARLCELMGYVAPQANELIYSLAVTCEKFRSIGLGKGHLLLFLYKAAALTKSDLDPADMETLVAVTEHQINKKPKSNRGTNKWASQSP